MLINYWVYVNQFYILEIYRRIRIFFFVLQTEFKFFSNVYVFKFRTKNFQYLFALFFRKNVCPHKSTFHTFFHFFLMISSETFSRSLTLPGLCLYLFFFIFNFVIFFYINTFIISQWRHTNA